MGYELTWTCGGGGLDHIREGFPEEVMLGGILGRGRWGQRHRGGRGLLGRGVGWQEHGEMNDPPLGRTAGCLRVLEKKAPVNPQDKLVGH